MLRLYLTDCFVRTEDVLTLDLDDEFLEALDGTRIVRLRAILVIIVPNNRNLKHVKELLDAHRFPIYDFQLLIFFFTLGRQFSHAGSRIFRFNHSLSELFLVFLFFCL